MSHHSSDWDDEAKKAMSAAMRQAFGEFPNGRLNQQDEGAIACAVGHEKGVVKLLFDHYDCAVARIYEKNARIAKLEAALVAEHERREAALRVVWKQAEDDGLWFDAQTAPEAYLQQALRQLHAVVEGK